MLSPVLAQVAGAFEIGATQIEIAAIPDVDHRPLRIPVSYENAADRMGLTVISDAAWAAPALDEGTGEIVVAFTTGTLVNRTNTATITLSRDGTSDQVFVKATVSPMNIVALADDPVRSRTYAVQQDGVNMGAVMIIDPVSGASHGNLSIGRKPTDLVATPDGQELLVICSASQSISVIDLTNLTLKPSISLPVYNDWGVSDTSANIELGPGNIIYYTDGAWAPVLHVLDRVAGTVVQTPDNPTSFGFGDIVVAADRSSLFGWAQYGWHAGSSNSFAVKYSIGNDGRLTFVESSPQTYPTGMSRDPLNTPALISLDGLTVITKQRAYPTASLQSPVREFSGPIFSATPEMEIVATGNAIFDFLTGNQLYTLPAASTVQVITSDYTRLVCFDPSAKMLRSIDLIAAIGEELLGRAVSPTDGAITLSPSRLIWSPMPGIDRYRVYLGTTQEAVAGATPESPEYKGEVTTTSYDLPAPLTTGQEYFWRVDTVSNVEVFTGTVRQFTVSIVGASLSRIAAATVQGHASFRVPVELTSETPGQPWSAAATASWITFEAATGQTPTTLAVVLDASDLQSGVHQGSVDVTASSGTFSIPVTFEVDPLELTHIKSKPGSATLYAISEQVSNATPRAYLLELDASTERITRVVPAGRSVTDIAVHAAENRIYVTNWMGGSLLAFDQATLELARTYAFQPFGGTGYGEGDVYRVAAGGLGRVIVEEEDQWIDISIYDTTGGTRLASAFVREGGGQYAPDLRHYYHGENNSSGAKLIKFDTVADTFSQVASVRVEHTTYYGSRVVVLSEDGSRIFWAGGVFRPDLTEEWALKDIIHAASTDGRYAFGEKRIYDVTARQAILGMPADTKVSGFNTETAKLVAQVGPKIGFFVLNGSATMPAPVLSVGTVESTRATLVWTEQSLETGFTLQRRLDGEIAWTDVNATIAQNTTTFTITGLAEATTHEFRIKADSPGASSTWSNVVSLTTPANPPGHPTLHWITSSSSHSVALSWWIGGSYETVHVERRSAGSDWVQQAEIPYPASGYSDTGLAPNTTYDYRIRTARLSQYSAYSEARSVTTPPLPPVVTITNHPRDTTAFPGQMVTLGVMFTGQGPVTFQWHKDGVAIHGASLQTLRFTSVSVADSGSYTVAITNAAGTVLSQPAVLTVPGTTLTSVYFGTFSGNRGRWALARINATQVFFLAFLTDPAGVIATAVPISATGAFSGQVNLALQPAGAGSPTSLSMVLSGQIASGVVTGSFPGTDITFAGVADAANGQTKSISGLYSAGGIGSANGMLFVIAGTNGDALAVIASSQQAQGVAGTIGAAGAFVLENANGTRFTGTISPSTSSIHASVQSGGGGARTYASILPTAQRTDRLVNFSSRGASGTGSNVMIAGFVVGGTTPRTMLIRGAGPALDVFEVANFAEDALLDLYQDENHLLHNDDWEQSGANAISAAASLVGAFPFTSGSRDSALLVDLAPGAYTAISRAASGAGVVLTEVYDVTSVSDTVNAVKNLSIRAHISRADEPIIAGFVVQGNSPKRVLIRAVGPGLATFDIPPAELLANPVLTVKHDQETVHENDDWISADATAKAASAAELGAFPLGAGSLDAVVLTTLLPGAYTAVATGHGGTGIVLVEVYQLD